MSFKWKVWDEWTLGGRRHFSQQFHQIAAFYPQTATINVSFSLPLYFLSDADELQLDTLITFLCCQPEPCLLRPSVLNGGCRHQSAARSFFYFRRTFYPVSQISQKINKISQMIKLNFALSDFFFFLLPAATLPTLTSDPCDLSTRQPFFY